MLTLVAEVEGQLYGKISEYNELETMIAGKDRKITTLQDTVTAEKKKQEQWKAKLDENELKYARDSILLFYLLGRGLPLCSGSRT